MASVVEPIADIMATKRVIAFVIAAALVLTGVVAVALRYGTRGEKQPVEAKAVKGEVLSIEECGIASETFEPFSINRDAQGMTTMLGIQYKKNDPLVEMAFMSRTLDGRIVPLRIGGIEFADDEEGGGVAMIPVEGVGLRLDVQEIREYGNSRSVLLGHSYAVERFTVSGKGERNSSRIGDRTFVVPADLQPNQAYRVRLILRDEIYQKELMQKKQEEKPFWRR